MFSYIPTKFDEDKLKKELKDLVDNHPRSYFNSLKTQRFKYLFDYIESKTPLLEEPCYRISTKVHWVLHDMTDFPICPECGNKFGIRKNVSFRGYSEFCSVKCLNRSDKHKHACKVTFLRKYGVDNPAKSTRVKNTARNTTLDRYGTPHVFQNADVKRKTKETWLTNYGVDNPNKNPSIRKKIENTCLERYDAASFLSSNEMSKFRRQTIKYKENYFDSKAELLFFKRCLKLGINIKISKQNIPYKYNNQIFHYNPDFEVNGLLIEIKGDHFFKLNDKGVEEMFCPFRNDKMSDEEYSELCAKYQAKYLCMLNNDVKIIKSSHVPDFDYTSLMVENNKFTTPDELFGVSQSEVVEICLNSAFPGTVIKWPADHPIWDCNIAGKLSPLAAWSDRASLESAVFNMYWIIAKSINENKYPDFVAKHKLALIEKKTQLLRLVLNRFTIAKIAPKVTAISHTLFNDDIEKTGIDLSPGVYCPMAGFGGLIKGAERWFKKRNKPLNIEAYDINKRLCDYYGWVERDVLAQKIKTDKVVIACPPFGDSTEVWKGTDNKFLLNMEDWCLLIKEYIEAPRYIFFGPNKLTNKEDKHRFKSGVKPCSLFRNKIQASCLPYIDRYSMPGLSIEDKERLKKIKEDNPWIINDY